MGTVSKMAVVISVNPSVIDFMLRVTVLSCPCLALYVTLYFNISQAHLSRNYEKTVDNRGITVYSRQHPQSWQHSDTM